MPMASQAIIQKRSKQLSLGMPMWHPLFLLTSNDHRYFTWNYIFIRHISWVLLGSSCILWVFACFAFQFLKSILAGHTYLREPKLLSDLLKLLSMLHLNLYELWNCSSASLISFWVWCALLFLKKCSHASHRLIWESVKNLRNSLLLHLNYFERKKIFMLMFFT